MGLINFILLFIFLIFIVPKELFKKKDINLIKIIRENLPFIMIIIGVVLLHLIEVNLIDSYVTEWIGHDFAENIKGFEGDIVFWFSQNWTPALVYFFALIYIAVYPFTLWFTPAYFLITNNKKSLKTLAYGFLLIYMIALPFYLFLPITNVYTFYNQSSALETVIPTVEKFFYSTTTRNNCLPSLHTAMTILVAYSISLTENKKFTYFGYFIMITVIISVIYLSIHWILDVIAGTLLAIGVILLLKYFMMEKEKDE